MKFYKYWTQFETQMSAFMNLRKAFADKYLMKADYGRIDIWDKNEKHLITIFVEASASPAHEAFQELASQEGVRRFRLCGWSVKVVELMTPYL
jgi:hypothetical protein